MVRKLVIVNLCLLVLFLSTAIVNSWTHGSIAQSILSSLQVTATNPTLGGDPNDQRAVDFNCTYDNGATVNSLFTDTNCFQLSMTTTWGLNAQPIGSNGSKTTPAAMLTTGNYYGAGQHVMFSDTINCIGMSDCAIRSGTTTYATGPIAGDEGQALQLFSHLLQQNSLDLENVLSVPAMTTCNTTATQAITGGPAVQTITVASATGCNVGDWLDVDHELMARLSTPLGHPNNEGVQITAVSSGHISGIFRLTHLNGVTLRPAKVIGTDTGRLGQYRTHVNLTATPYTTGTILQSNGGQIVGSGTGWSVSMVGGNANNIGCISFAADDYNAAPFNGSGSTGTLRSWYQILAVTDATHLGVYSMSVAGDNAYYGKLPASPATGAVAYTIRPCIEVLMISGHTIIAENTATTWNVSDIVEQSIVPYPDASGLLYDMAKYTPGGINRGFLTVYNRGARTAGIGINLASDMTAGSNADTVAWGIGLSVAGAGVAFESLDSVTAAVVLGCGYPFCSGTPGTTDNRGKIMWSGGGTYIMPNAANDGMDMQLTMSGAGGLLRTKDATIIGSGSVASLQYTGMIGTDSHTFSQLPTCAAGLTGMQVWLSDSNTATFGGTISGSGANKGIAACDGTNWTYR